MSKVGVTSHRRSTSKKRRIARDNVMSDVTSLPEEQPQQGKLSKRQPLAERMSRMPTLAHAKAQQFCANKVSTAQENAGRHGKNKVFDGTENRARPARATKTAAKAKLRASSICYIQEDEPMEMEPANVSLLTLSVSVPDCIQDIDYHDDYFLCPEYAQDIISYLKNRENQSLLPTDYLVMSPEVTSQMRCILMDWLIQVQDHEELEEETLELSVAITDQFLARAPVTVRQVQLVGVTALLIAAKYIERFPPMISTLCSLTAGTYNTCEVLEMEKVMLSVLQFDVSFPVPIVFLRRFLFVHPHDVQVEQLARYLLDLSLPSQYMVSVLPSMLAASALYVARKVWLPEEPEVWTPALVHYTGYRPGDIVAVIRMLASMLLRAGISKYQKFVNIVKMFARMLLKSRYRVRSLHSKLDKAARDKHSQEQSHGSISQNPVLEDHPGLLHLASTDLY